jgi:hypothetical protein
VRKKRNSSSLNLTHYIFFKILLAGEGLRGYIIRAKLRHKG